MISFGFLALAAFGLIILFIGLRFGTNFFVDCDAINVSITELLLHVIFYAIGIVGAIASFPETQSGLGNIIGVLAIVITFCISEACIILKEEIENKATAAIVFFSGYVTWITFSFFSGDIIRYSYAIVERV